MAMLDGDRGAEFPAILTHRYGIDKKLMDYMRPIVDAGCSIEAFANAVSEVHRKRWKQRMLKHEEEQYRAATQSLQLGGRIHLQPYSDYLNPQGYCGWSASRGYWVDVYLAFQKTVRQHYDMSVKIRSGEDLDIDASYKLTKKFARHAGTPIFGCTQTGTNNYHEIRLQHFAMTDAQDQLETTLNQMKESMAALGQDQPKRIKPAVHNKSCWIRFPYHPMWSSSINRALAQFSKHHRCRIQEHFGVDDLRAAWRLTMPSVCSVASRI